MRTDLIELKTTSEKAYEKRDFSRDLGISATALSEFQAGKRELSFKNVDTVFKYLNSKIHCSWCDKEKKEVSLLVGGPRRQFICNECIDECNRLVSANRMKKIYNCIEKMVKHLDLQKFS